MMTFDEITKTLCHCWAEAEGFRPDEYCVSLRIENNIAFKLCTLLTGTTLRQTLSNSEHIIRSNIFFEYAATRGDIKIDITLDDLLLLVEFMGIGEIWKALAPEGHYTYKIQPDPTHDYWQDYMVSFNK